MSSRTQERSIGSMANDSPYGNPETRARILDAAWRLVEEQGAGVTMAAVARAAGVSRQAVYLHFSARSRLFIALIDHINQRIDLDAWLRPVREAPSGRVALERMIAAHAGYHDRISGAARVLDAARHDDPEVAAAWDDRMSLRLEDHRRIVRRIAEEEGLAPGWDVESAGRLFYTLTLPWVWDQLLGQDFSAEECREHLTRTLSRMLLIGRSP